MSKTLATLLGLHFSDYMMIIAAFAWNVMKTYSVTHDSTQCWYSLVEIVFKKEKKKIRPVGYMGLHFSSASLSDNLTTSPLITCEAGAPGTKGSHGNEIRGQLMEE